MMEQKQIYNEKTFLLSILFGPLLATLGLAGNFRRMGQGAGAVLTWIFGILVTFIYTIVCFSFLSANLFYYFLSMFIGSLIVAIISLGIFQNFQKPYFMMNTPEASAYGFMHCVGAGIVATIVYTAGFYLTVIIFVLMAPQTVDRVIAQEKLKAEVHVSNCFAEFSKHTEESDADHVRNMMNLQSCAAQDDSEDSAKLQACAKAALAQYQIDPDGKMGNRAVVDAEFIRCLSQ